MLKVADDMQTTATTFNITMESVLAMKTAMAESGIETDKFLKILGNLKKSQGEVIRGTATYVDAVEALNLTQEEFLGTPIDQLLETIASRYVEAGESAAAYNGVATIFGSRVGVQLIEVFKRLNGAGGLQTYIEQTKAAADGMRELAAASDELEKLGNKITIFTGKTIGGLSAGIRFLRGQSFAEQAAAKLAKRAREEEIKGAITTAENLAALKEARDNKEKTRLEKLATATEKIEKIKLAAALKIADLNAGKGITAPFAQRTSRLQTVGGVAGGLTQGAQLARIAERQNATQEKIEAAIKIMNDKISKISEKMTEIVDE
jgi:hypothetical protein